MIYYKLILNLHGIIVFLQTRNQFFYPGSFLYPEKINYSQNSTRQKSNPLNIAIRYDSNREFDRTIGHTTMYTFGDRITISLYL